MHRQHRLEVLDDVGVQAAHDTQFIGDPGEVRKDLADPQARLPMPAKAERRAEQRLIARFIGTQPERRHRPAMVARRRGL